MTEKNCPFCEFDEYDIIDKNEFGVILPEQNPLTKGHSVIIPVRHIASFFEITDKERKSIQSLLELARNELKIRHQPEGFHIAFNDGNVFDEKNSGHLHIHIIPRYKDQPLVLDQRWGVIAE
ncbi:HIT family protein [Acinetobacter sp. ANC 4648]|uniref:HIT family protein n=1 Tax=Acinetobacter sp. ANC 4648 TaxID=1977875 RepID=UPI000A34EDC4|nr:HIT family protein [Acinetobacter sp. ANC 4648]OTG85080.1 HIT family protein [Acinetobacter sp. ANC 4648]